MNFATRVFFFVWHQTCTLVLFWYLRLDRRDSKAEWMNAINRWIVIGLQRNKRATFFWTTTKSRTFNGPMTQSFHLNPLNEMLRHFCRGCRASWTGVAFPHLFIYSGAFFMRCLDNESFDPFWCWKIDGVVARASQYRSIARLECSNVKRSIQMKPIYLK